jgi:hypothetical protein
MSRSKPCARQKACASSLATHQLRPTPRTPFLAEHPDKDSESSIGSSPATVQLGWDGRGGIRTPEAGVTRLLVFKTFCGVLRSPAVSSGLRR